MILRGYQVPVVDKLMEFVEANANKANARGFVVMPGGSGKTVIFTEFVRRLGEKTIVVAPTYIILEQNLKTMRSQNPEAKITVYHRLEKDLDGDIIITTYQSLVSLLRRNAIARDFARIIIFDEVHKSLSLKRSKIPEKLNAICIGFTATDKFSVQKNVERIFQNEIYRMHLWEAIEGGILLPLRGFIVETRVDLRNIRISCHNSLDEEVAERVLNIEARNKTARDFYLEKFKGIPAVAFCVSIAHAKELAKYFRESGVKAEAIHAGTEPKLRKAIINAFNNSQIGILCSRDILIEGWDSSRVAVALNLRPTYSWVLAEQRACRVVRPHPGKEWGIVVEFQDIYDRRDQPIFIHHLFGEKKYRQGGYVIASSTYREAEEKTLEKHQPVFIIGDIQVSSIVRQVVDLKPIGTDADFNDKELIKEILLTRTDIDYRDLSLHNFLHLHFHHPRFQGTGDTLLRKHLGVLWGRTVEDYEIFIQDILGDYFFEKYCIGFHEINTESEEMWRNFVADTPTPEKMAIDAEEKDRICQVLNTLTPREARVAKMQFGINDDNDHTFREIGEYLGVTDTRAQQIAAKAMRKLKYPFRQKRLKFNL